MLKISSSVNTYLCDAYVFSNKVHRCTTIYIVCGYMIYILLTAIGFTPSGSSTVLLYTLKQNTQNRTYLTIRMYKNNNKNM
jgi:hypothetical protein